MCDSWLNPSECKEREAGEAKCSLACARRSTLSVPLALLFLRPPSLRPQRLPPALICLDLCRTPMEPHEITSKLFYGGLQLTLGKNLVVRETFILPVLLLPLYNFLDGDHMTLCKEAWNCVWAGIRHFVEVFDASWCLGILKLEKLMIFAVLFIRLYTVFSHDGHGKDWNSSCISVERITTPIV